MENIPEYWDKLGLEPFKVCDLFVNYEQSQLR